MEKYGDERFMNGLKDRQVLLQNEDIRQGSVYIDEELIQFTEREIIKNRFWMWLPEEFALMSKQHAKLKYPNENRPEIIYSNKAGNVNAAFSQQKSKLRDGAEGQIRDFMEQVIMRFYPSSHTIEK